MGEPSTEGGAKRSRRDVIAGVAGAVGVVAAQSILGAEAAYAGSDGDVVLGVDNQSTSGATGVQTTNITGLHGRSTNITGSGVFGEALNGSGIGVHGTGAQSGVVGDGQDDGVVGHGDFNGVFGSSDLGGSGVGVNGSNSSGDGGVGVRGSATGAGSEGVFGRGNTGVHGVSPATGGVGVRAQADNGTAVLASGGSRAVDATGFDDGGVAIAGLHAGQGGIGVRGEGAVAGTFGRSATVTGAYGEGGLIGVHAVSLQPGGSGVGLRVDGRSVFRTAGIATVPSGANKVTVALAGVTSTDMVLATVQQGGGFYVKYAKAGNGQFTIQINTAPTSPTTVKVAWFVLSAS
ncbi:MAG: hypothetical protein M3P18_14730 [Actinomycetota bacterium]|nr:hypothetical protein [Actinomycetota bacterium]